MVMIGKEELNTFPRIGISRTPFCNRNAMKRKLNCKETFRGNRERVAFFEGDLHRDISMAKRDILTILYSAFGQDSKNRFLYMAFTLLNYINTSTFY